MISITFSNCTAHHGAGKPYGTTMSDDADPMTPRSIGCRRSVLHHVCRPMRRLCAFEKTPQATRVLELAGFDGGQVIGTKSLMATASARSALLLVALEIGSLALAISGISELLAVPGRTQALPRARRCQRRAAQLAIIDRALTRFRITFTTGCVKQLIETGLNDRQANPWPSFRQTATVTIAWHRRTNDLPWPMETERSVHRGLLARATETKG